VVNKCDGDLRAAANRAVADYRHAVHMLRPKHPGWEVPVLPVSALEGSGIDDVWTAVERLDQHLRASDALERLRSGQAVAWMDAEIRETLLDSFRRDAQVAARWGKVEAAVRAGRLSPGSAARELLDAAGRHGEQGEDRENQSGANDRSSGHRIDQVGDDPEGTNR
jgi:GTPase